MPRHTWTTEDDDRLLAAVEAIKDNLPKNTKLWSAVVGRLLPELAVTSNAARTRFDRVARDRANESKGDEDKWSVVAEQVMSAEKDSWDHLFDRLDDLQEDMSRIRRDMEKLKSSWE